MLVAGRPVFRSRICVVIGLRAGWAAEWISGFIGKKFLQTQTGNFGLFVYGNIYFCFRVMGYSRFKDSQHFCSRFSGRTNKKYMAEFFFVVCVFFCEAHEGFVGGTRRSPLFFGGPVGGRSVFFAHGGHVADPWVMAKGLKPVFMLHSVPMQRCLFQNICHRFEWTGGRHAFGPACASTAKHHAFNSLLPRHRVERVERQRRACAVGAGNHLDGRPQILRRLMPPSGKILSRM